MLQRDVFCGKEISQGDFGGDGIPDAFSTQERNGVLSHSLFMYEAAENLIVHAIFLRTESAFALARRLRAELFFTELALATGEAPAEVLDGVRNAVESVSTERPHKSQVIHNVYIYIYCSDTKRFSKCCAASRIPSLVLKCRYRRMCKLRCM